MGKLYVVGFGPGNADNMTKLCVRALQESDIIIGYTGYTKLLRPLFPDKTYYETGMTQETKRCLTAIEMAAIGKTVSIISSGDAGIYGMASLIFELAEETQNINIEIVAGVTAAVSGAALLGAPLGHDFTVISLSDLLTPWSIIEKRLRAAALGDFVICLYNPGSKKRADYQQKACDILLETIPADRVCGIARNIGREGQSVFIMTLGELRGRPVDMYDTVYIGNASTRNVKGRMITPRGYRCV